VELSKVIELGESLLERHNLSDWKMTLDNAVRRFGVCKHRLKTISVSKRLALANERKAVNDVILHEIAHALTPGHHHNSVWRAKCREIGAIPERCVDNSRIVQAESRLIGECPSCDTVHNRHRKPKSNRSCGKCDSTKYNTKYKLTWRLNPKYTTIKTPVVKKNHGTREEILQRFKELGIIK
jgi:predicted SprT family Zn-dependent metalloprotease